MGPRARIAPPIREPTTVEAIVDLDARWTVEPSALHYKHPWSLHEGAEITGRVVATVRAGELAYADGEVLAAPGSGALL